MRCHLKELIDSVDETIMKEFLKDFEFHIRAKNLTPKTISVYGERLGYFTRYLRKRKVEINEEKKQHIQDYILFQKDRGDICTETFNKHQFCFGSSGSNDCKACPGNFLYSDYNSDSDSSSQSSDLLPLNFEVYQNYANPFNGNTIIKYDAPESGSVNFQVYNLLGKKIVDMLYKNTQAGSYQIELDDVLVSKLASGVYFYRITYGKQSITKKMLYLK